MQKKLEQELKKYDRLFYTYEIRNGGASTEVFKLVSTKIVCEKDFCSIKVQEEGYNYTKDRDFKLENLEELILTGSFEICNEVGYFKYRLLKPGEKVPKGYGNYESEAW